MLQEGQLQAPRNPLKKGPPATGQHRRILVGSAAQKAAKIAVIGSATRVGARTESAVRLGLIRIVRGLDSSAEV